MLRIRLHDGSLLEHRVDSSRGGPEHPLTAEELAGKFRANASRALPADRVEMLLAAVSAHSPAAVILPLTRGYPPSRPLS